jgi:hypothetical protein
MPDLPENDTSSSDDDTTKSTPAIMPGNSSALANAPCYHLHCPAISQPEDCAVPMSAWIDSDEQQDDPVRLTQTWTLLGKTADGTLWRSLRSNGRSDSGTSSHVVPSTKTGCTEARAGPGQ